MPLYGLNTNNIYVKNLRRQVDGTEIDNAVLTASVYDKTQIENVLKRASGTAISGASAVTLTFQSTSTTNGHYNGSIDDSVGLTEGQEVLVHYKDNGAYGIDVKIQTTVQRRTS